MTTPVPAPSPADQLNGAAESHAAAQAELTRLEQVRKRLAAASASEAERFSAAQRAQDAAIEAELRGESVEVPTSDRTALDFAERKLRAADAAVNGARDAVTRARTALQAADRAYACDLAVRTAREFSNSLRTHKSVGALLALQGIDEVRVALHDAGLYVARDRDGGLTIRIAAPASVPCTASVLANSLSPKAAPHAASHYRAAVEAENAAAEQVRAMRQAEIASQEEAALARLEASHESALSNANTVGKLALKARHLVDVQKLKAEYAAQRAN